MLEAQGCDKVYLNTILLEFVEIVIYFLKKRKEKEKTTLTR